MLEEPDGGRGGTAARDPGRELGTVDREWEAELADALWEGVGTRADEIQQGARVGQRRRVDGDRGVDGADAAVASDPPGVVAEVCLVGARREAKDETVLLGERGDHVEQVGAAQDPLVQECHVARADAPPDGPFELGAQLERCLLGVGVFDEVGGRDRESAIPARQRWCRGERGESQDRMGRGQRQRDTKVLASVATDDLGGPRARHHESSTGREATVEGEETPGGVRLRQPEELGDDDQLAHGCLS